MCIDTLIRCGYTFIYSASLLFKGNAISSKIGFSLYGGLSFRCCFSISFVMFPSCANDQKGKELLPAFPTNVSVAGPSAQGPHSPGSFCYLAVLSDCHHDRHHLSLSLILLACRDSATPFVEHQHTALCSVCSFAAEGFECIPSHR